ncbi:hypothetical protein [Phyllobacterium sp. SB3]|uniref:hypothetical protein n=1 Tax=Phyllobacterium sp. SB3 TaxID=3156073 RepID=UPI0032AF2DAE
MTVTELPTFVAHDLGPLLELVHMASNANARSETSKYLLAPNHSNLLKSLRKMNSWFGSFDGQGFVPVTQLVDDKLAWTDFILRSKRAATSVGFSNDSAGKLIAAIGEIYGNIVDHSERIETGYVAYSTRAGKFEFVVGDSGVGVLRSLQTNSQYADISDSGSALELSLKEGVSRFLEPGHGFGFRPLFVGLANISRTIRFRSGDYGCTLSRSPDGHIHATTTQLAKISGLFCAVECELDS